LEPVFLEGNLDGVIYLTLLQEDVMPALATLFPNPLDPDLANGRIWYQQDGAPPYYAVIVRRYLDEVFRNRCIGRRGQIEWPARSRDLTPLDFFYGGYLKSEVYVTKPNTVEYLKQRVRHEIRQITAEMLQNVRDACYYRFAICQERNGAHFDFCRF
jgi:hypothetical protein